MTPAPAPAAPHLTIAQIQRAVAEYYGLPIEIMTSHSRVRRVARPRQIAMYLVRQMTGLSLRVIAMKFGGRDHSTIFDGISRIAEMVLMNPEIAADVAALRAVLGDAPARAAG